MQWMSILFGLLSAMPCLSAWHHYGLWSTVTQTIVPAEKLSFSLHSNLDRIAFSDEESPVRIEADLMPLSSKEWKAHNIHIKRYPKSIFNIKWHYLQLYRQAEKHGILLSFYGMASPFSKVDSAGDLHLSTSAKWLYVRASIQGLDEPLFLILKQL